jgi:hypothetical protein
MTTQFDSHRSHTSSDFDFENSEKSRTTVNPKVSLIELLLARAFYRKFKVACIRCSSKNELELFYYATFHTFTDRAFDESCKNCPLFKKVLYAMVNSMNVVKRVGYNTLVWTEKLPPSTASNEHDPLSDVVRVYNNKYQETTQTIYFNYVGEIIGTSYQVRRLHSTNRCV